MANESGIAPPGDWSLTVDADGIAWLTIDRQGSSANALSRSVMRELDARLGDIERQRPRGLVICSGKASGFIAGADIHEFVDFKNEQEAYAQVRAGQQVIDRVAALPCPTVAAINGFALGGGLELALACNYRVAAGDARVSLGLPEVMLGLHPGFGGTVRAPQLLGVRVALDLMLTGRSLRADKALAVGLVDRLVPLAQLREAAVQILREAPARRSASFADRLLSLPVVRGFVAAQMEKQVARRTRREHMPAPFAIVDLWQRYGAHGAAAYEAEARSMAQLFCTDASRGLVRVFLLQDRLKALGPKQGPEFRHVHVVGAGVMGGDIAAWSAYRGMTVTLQDRGIEFITPALERARAFFAKRCQDAAEAAACVERLRADVAGDGVPQADVVVEAIFENVDAKRELYVKLEPRMQAGALLATNTSSIMLETLAEKLADPSRLVGLHFFNPVAKMPLVEIIHATDTREASLQRATAFARKLDKLPLPCRSAPGFVVNRILNPYMTEAMFAAQEGIPLVVIDQAALDFGMPQGPIELADTVGLDVAFNVGKILAAALGKPAPDSIAPLIAAKHLGRKSGQGFYTWVDGKPVKLPAPGVRAPADLQDRLILPLLNEAVACLREAVVSEADLLDAGVVFGTGFAPFRGGPLYYARQRGIPAIVQRLQELEARYGARFRPDSGWSELRP